MNEAKSPQKTAASQERTVKRPPDVDAVREHFGYAKPDKYHPKAAELFTYLLAIGVFLVGVIGATSAPNSLAVGNWLTISAIALLLPLLSWLHMELAALRKQLGERDSPPPAKPK